MSRARTVKHTEVANPGVPSAFAIRFLTRFVLPVVRLVNRATLEGTEHLPERGAFLLVANHPSSVGLVELHAFMALYVKTFGSSRPLAGFALASTFVVWPLSRLFPHIGAIPSTYEAAHSTLAKGVPIVVFPGGDHECMRPFWEFDHADFGGRVGFLRIAREAWIPIVPMGFEGVCAPLLFRSRLLGYLYVWPRLVGVKRFGLTALAAIGAALILWLVPVAWPWRALIAWAWAASPISLLSWWPARVRIRIGAPIAPETLFGDRTNDADEAVLRGALPVVERAVSALVVSV